MSTLCTGARVVLVAALMTGIAEATRDISAAHATCARFRVRPTHRRQPGDQASVRRHGRTSRAGVGPDALRGAGDGRTSPGRQFHAVGAKVVAADAAERNAAASCPGARRHGVHVRARRQPLRQARPDVLGHAFGDTRDALLGSSVSRRRCDERRARVRPGGTPVQLVRNSVRCRPNSCRRVHRRRDV